MMMSGHVAITVALDREGGLVGEPQLIARGIPGWHESEAMHDRLLDVVEGTLDKLKPAQAENDHKAAEAVRIAARRALDYEIGKRPVTDVRVIRLDDW
jgi:ribonuclease J